MSSTRKPLFERLPEVYRTRDQKLAQTTPLAYEDQEVKGPLQALLETLDEVFSSIHGNVDELYHDLFIETCADWVVPYIADLVGISHLSGDPWTLRGDAARAVKNRRRKGTLGAIESVTFTLTEWAVHSVELRERMVWNQHMNHQRPDAGGTPPLVLRDNIYDAVWGGTVTLRSPAVLRFLNSPFDPFAHFADFKPASPGSIRYNLPNLAVFLWRLESYQLQVTQPVFRAMNPVPPAPGAAAFAVRFDLDPTGHPLKLFNTHRYRADDEPPNLTTADAVPGPIPRDRLTSGGPMSNPNEYVRINLYSNAAPPVPSEVGLTLHLPETAFPLVHWTFRGANLCAWEDGLTPPIRVNEIAIDPLLGRIVFGVANNMPDGVAIRDGLLASPTYGISGPTGAHPISRSPTPDVWLEQTPTVVTVRFTDSPDALRDALAGLDTRTAPLIVEIDDSRTHDLDIAAVAGSGADAAGPTLLLGSSVWIRATHENRPLIRLVRPLAFRPADITGPNAPQTMANLNVRLEGLFVIAGAGFAPADPLIAQAAVNRLTLDGCTLDPGGQLLPDGTVAGSREPFRSAMRLTNTYGLGNPADEQAFDQTPVIELLRSITGALQIDNGYTVQVTGSIIDAGSGVGDSPGALALCAATGDAEVEWGPPLSAEGITAFGRMRVESVTGDGGIWVHRLEAHDNQKGCIRFSYLSGDADRIPPHHAAVFGPGARIAFTSEIFGEPGYAQLRMTSNRRILEEGPERDEMGAFGYLKNAHKWKNISIRYREFVPVGIKALPVPVT